jgi:hypothetical protein
MVDDIPQMFLFLRGRKDSPLQLGPYQDMEQLKSWVLKHIPDLKIEEQEAPPEPITADEKKQLDEDERHEKAKVERAAHQKMLREQRKLAREERQMLSEARKAMKETDSEL